MEEQKAFQTQKQPAIKGFPELRWTGKRRPQVDLCPAQMKIRWEVSNDE